MTRIAAETTGGVALPEPCGVHIVSIDGASILFPKSTLDQMNKALALGIVGGERIGACAIETHELDYESTKVLIARERLRGGNAHVFQIIYIPIADKILAYASFRDGAGQIVGKSERYELPVQKDKEILTTAALLPKPKLKTKLLTEVHFDSASAKITFVGNQKIQKAIEAIKKDNPIEIRIFGFTDTLGDPVSTKATAQARADSVASAIREAGLDIPLVVEGRGEGVGPYKTPDGLSEPLNRCVGIIAVFEDTGK
jgi:outer membrane protein OmpA-like peptidoglycan-associated protein